MMKKGKWSECVVWLSDCVSDSEMMLSGRLNDMGWVLDNDGKDEGD